MINAADLAAVLAFVALHPASPPVDCLFPFAAAPEALRHLNRGEQFGKVVLCYERTGCSGSPSRGEVSSP